VDQEIAALKTGAWLIRAALRGGGFPTGAVAGVFALALDFAPSRSDCTLGFRACKSL